MHMTNDCTQPAIRSSRRAIRHPTGIWMFKMKKTATLFFTVIASFICFAETDPEQNPVLLTVLGTNYFSADIQLDTVPGDREREYMKKNHPEGVPDIWEYCYGLRHLAELITKPLNQIFVEKNGVTPTDADLAEFIELSRFELNYPGATITNSIGIMDDLSDEERKSTESTAMLLLWGWKFENALYKSYGGRIADTGHEIKVFDAYFNYLKECEEQNMFTIHNEEVKNRFWTCITNLPNPVIYLSQEDGEAALFEHPALKLKREVTESVSNLLKRAREQNATEQEP